MCTYATQWLKKLTRVLYTINFSKHFLLKEQSLALGLAIQYYSQQKLAVDVIESKDLEFFMLCSQKLLQKICLSGLIIAVDSYCIMMSPL